MKITDPIIQTALLDTGNKELDCAQLPKAISEFTLKIKQKAEDAEDMLYRAMAASFAYQKAGWEAQSGTNVLRIRKATEEKLPYLNQKQNEIFSRLNQTYHLLAYAYQKAMSLGKIIAPEQLQFLIRRAYDTNNPRCNEERKSLAILAGNRGKWLLQYLGFEDWDKDYDEIWDTSSFRERKQILTLVRIENPSHALELLQNSWKSESASHRKELLEILGTNLSKNDEPFLKEIAESDRSVTVKDLATALLCKISDSYIIKRYREILLKNIKYDSSNGWSYKEISYTPEMSELGIEEISQNKNEKDGLFLLRQMAQKMPFSFWCELFGCSDEQAAKNMVQNPPFKKYFSLEETILNFNDGAWAYNTIIADQSYEKKDNLLGLLSPSQREMIKWNTERTEFNYIPESWCGCDFETWGPSFSSYVIGWISDKKYMYNYSDSTERLAIHLNPQVREKINSLTYSEEISPSVREFYIDTLKFLDLKTEIDTLFKENQ